MATNPDVDITTSTLISLQRHFLYVSPWKAKQWSTFMHFPELESNFTVLSTISKLMPEFCEEALDEKSLWWRPSSKPVLSFCFHYSTKPTAASELATFIVWSVTPGPRIKWYRGQEKFLTSRHVCMHRVVFYISNTLRKVMIRALVWCLGKCFWLGFGLEKEKQLTSKTRSNIFQRFYLFPYCSLLWVSDI